MNWLRRFLTRSSLYQDLAGEIQQHLDEKADELVNEGMPREQAILAARRDFGNVALMEQSGREAWGWRWLEDFLADLRFGARQLARNPVVAVVSVLTLALGIGANVALFSVVYSVLLRPLPFKDPGRLVLVHEYKAGDIGKTGSPLVRYQTRAAQKDIFEESGGYWDVSGGNEVVFGDGSTVQRLRFSIVTRSFFPLLGIQPAMGRLFAEGDDEPGGQKIFLASYALWSKQLGADPQAVGRQFRLDGEPYTLIGVLPKSFNFPAKCDIWMPIGVLGPGLVRDRASHQFWMVARLRPGIALQRAQEEMNVVQGQLAQAFPASDSEWGVVVTPLLDELVGNVRRSLWILLGAVGFVLLIACTNVVNLLLARAVSRQREFAIRAAIGAGRFRLIRQSLAESLIIAAAGGVLALLVGGISLQIFTSISAGYIPRLEEPTLHPATLVYCAAVALLTTLLVGVAPGLHAAGSASADSLALGQRSGTGSRGAARLRSLLVISEVALTLLLLTGAGLMLRSLAQLHSVDPGFRPRDLVSLKIALPDALYPKAEQRATFLRNLLDRLNATPGITIAAAADRLPLSGDRNWGAINISGQPLLDAAHAHMVEGRTVSANYFRALRVPLLRGRLFTDTDTAEGRHPILINQTMADQLWPGADPIGQRISGVYHPEISNEVVGVVGNVKEFGLEAPAPPEMYAPYQWWNVMNLLVDGSSGSSSLVATVRWQVAALDSQVPVYDVTSMEEIVNRSLARLRFEFLLLSAFAGLALALASVGIYGLMAFAVLRRTPEVGLRLALGASRTGVMVLMIWQGMKLILLGTAAGVLLSLALGSVLGNLLFEISPSDPLTLAANALLIAIIGALACIIPARRATRVDPMTALRSE